mgnify:CR=1 FL=1
MDPWGTPQVIGWSSDRMPLTNDLCRLHDTYDLNHFSVGLSIAINFNLVINKEWSTVSNALRRSKKMIPLIIPLDGWMDE